MTNTDCRALCTRTPTCNAYYSEANPATNNVGYCVMYTRSHCFALAPPGQSVGSGGRIYMSAGEGCD